MPSLPNDGSGSISLANTWQEVFPLNKSRKMYYISNPTSNSDNLDVGIGESGSELLIETLTPGDSWNEAIPNPVKKQRIVVRSTATIPFKAHEEI